MVAFSYLELVVDSLLFCKCIMFRCGRVNNNLGFGSTKNVQRSRNDYDAFDFLLISLSTESRLPRTSLVSAGKCV